MGRLNLISTLTVNGSYSDDPINGSRPTLPINQRKSLTIEPGTDSGEGDLVFFQNVEILPLGETDINLSESLADPLNSQRSFANVRQLRVEPDAENEYALDFTHPGCKRTGVSIAVAVPYGHGHSDNTHVSVIVSIFAASVSIYPGGVYFMGSNDGIEIGADNNILRFKNPSATKTAYAKIMIGGVASV